MGKEIIGKLNHFADEPLYHQLKEIFRKNIILGNWIPGEKLPNQVELANMYGVSLAVVRQAVEHLVNEGFLLKRQGKGTFVIDSRIHQGPQKLTYLTEELSSKGLKAGSEVIESKIIPANERTSKIFSINPETPVVMIKRLRIMDNIPLGIQTFYCPKKFLPGILNDDLTSSLYEILSKNYGINIVSADEKYYATLLDRHECKLFKVRWPFAGFLVERTGYDLSGFPVEYTESIIRADKYSVEINLRK